MAKSQYGLVSLDTTKTFGKAIVFQGHRGGTTIRKRVIPKNPQSVLQVATRAAFASAGKFIHLVDKTKAFYAIVKEFETETMAWNSALVKEIVGTALVNWDAAKSAYDSETTVAGYFDTTAGAMGLVDYVQPGETPVTVPAGQILSAAYFAAQRDGDPLAQTAYASATQQNVSDWAAGVK
jgi:hypothetical protein